jgi:pimeloyl-ACP methyl ester carboxylesterase
MSWFEHGPSRIYYEESGSGDPLLFLPGFSESIAGHALLRESLVTRYRVIAADLPGSGCSEPQPRQYTAGYLLDDARSLGALLQKVADRPAHLVGFSDGGEVALLMASQVPEIARSVLAWGAAGFVSDPSGQLCEAMHNVVDRPTPPWKQYSEYLIATYGVANARAMTRSLAKAISATIEAAATSVVRRSAVLPAQCCSSSASTTCLPPKLSSTNLPSISAPPKRLRLKASGTTYTTRDRNGSCKLSSTG